MGGVKSEDFANSSAAQVFAKSSFHTATVWCVTPTAAAISVASPITGDVIRLTNNPWVIRPSLIGERLGCDSYTIINDFGAVGHAVAQLPADDFVHLCGPDTPLPDAGVTTVCGPGTGLGVAQVFKARDGYHVLPTEGGHIDYAPLDSIEDAIVARLRKRLEGTPLVVKTARGLGYMAYVAED